MRPQLNRHISPDDLKNYYWLKEELQAFSKSLGLKTTGSKMELLERIVSYLVTGQKEVRTISKKNPSGVDWKSDKLSLDTVITDSYRNTENVRAFMKKQIGPYFKFNVEFIKWMRNNTGKKLKDAIVEWKEIEIRKMDKNYKTLIDAQFEYNTYIRDFLADNPGKTMRDAVKYWNRKKEERGSRKYSPLDMKKEPGAGNEKLKTKN